VVADVPGGQQGPGDPTRLGTHVLADIVEVADPTRFATDFLADAFADALRAAGATIRRFVVEEFVPQGVSVMAVLAESHASLHTWPEQRTVLVDVFACGGMSPQEVVEQLAARLGRCTVRMSQVERHAGRPAVEVGTT
jgi:S-adenosylmethionine decarboxylase proenzyme